MKIFNLHIVTTKQLQKANIVTPFGFTQRLFPYNTEITATDFFKNVSGTCVNLISSTVAQINNYAAQPQPGGQEEKPLPSEHWMNRLLDEPNQVINQSWFEIKEQAIKWLYYNGNAFLWFPKNVNNYKFPTQVWCLPGNWRVQIIPSMTPDKLIEGYQFYTQNGTIYINYDEICHIKTIGTSDEFNKNFFLGSPIYCEAAIDAIQADDETKRFIRESFKDDNIRPMYLSYGTGNDAPSQEEVSQYKEKMNSDLVRSKIISAIGYNAKLEPVPTNEFASKALNSMFNTENNEKAIARAFMIPWEIFDSTKNSYASAYVAKQLLHENSISVAEKRITSALTMYLKKFEPITIKSQFNTILDPALELQQEDSDFKHGVLTRNDIRKRRGLEKLIDGDMPLITSDMVTIESLINPPEIPQNIIPQNEPIKYLITKTKELQPVKFQDMTEEMKLKIWKKLDSTISIREKKLREKIAKTLNDLKEKLLKGLESRAKILPSVTFIQVKTWLTDLDVFNLEDWMKIIKDNTTPEMYELLSKTITETLKTYNIDGSLSDFEKQIAEATKASTDKIAESINTIKEELKAKIKSIVENNPTLSKEELYKNIIDEVKDSFDGTAKTEGYIKARAKNISQTTTTYATGKIQKNIAEEYKLERFWLTQRDGKVRPSHRLMDGKKADDKGYFHLGGYITEHPAGTGLPAEEACYCRCYQFMQKG